MVTVDYAGDVFTLESFTAQTTNGSGEITVTLANIPVDDTAFLINLQGVAGAFAQFTSRSGANVTITVYQKYDKIDTSSGYATNMPASVTADSTVGGPSFTSGGPSATITNVGSSGGNEAGSATHTHATITNKVITHSHDIVATALSTLDSTGGLTVTIGYAF